MAAPETEKRKMHHYVCAWEGKGNVTQTLEALLRENLLPAFKDKKHIWKQPTQESDPEIRVLAHQIKEHEKRGISFEYLLLEGDSNAFSGVLNEETGECDLNRIVLVNDESDSAKKNLMLNSWCHVTVIGDQVSITFAKGRSSGGVMAYIKYLRRMRSGRERARFDVSPKLAEGINENIRKELTDVQSITMNAVDEQEENEANSGQSISSPSVPQLGSREILKQWLSRATGHAYVSGDDADFKTIGGDDLRREGFAVSIQLRPVGPIGSEERLASERDIINLAERILGDEDASWRYTIRTSKGVLQKDLEKLTEEIEVVLDKQRKPMATAVFDKQHKWLEQLLKYEKVKLQWKPASAAQRKKEQSGT